MSLEFRLKSKTSLLSAKSISTANAVATSISPKTLKIQPNILWRVSPFFKNDGHYEILSKLRDKSVFVKINYIVKNKIRLKAFLNATIIKSDNITLFLALVKNLIFPGKVWINIHYQALKLFLKKIKIEKKPYKPLWQS